MGTKKKMSLGLEWKDRGILSEKDQSKNGPRTNTKSKKQIQKTKTKQKKTAFRILQFLAMPVVNYCIFFDNNNKYIGQKKL